MINAYLIKEETGFIIVNVDNDFDAQRIAKMENSRELTTEEKSIFVDGLQFAGGANTTVSGTSLDDVVIKYTAITETEKNDKQWSLIRQQRDPLLVEADYIINKAIDTGNTELESVARVYRQSLRDVTLQEDPFNIVWPAKP